MGEVPHSGDTPACANVSTQYSLTCYAPLQLKLAEASFPGRVIDPSKAVKRVTGLDLMQVVTGQRALPVPGSKTAFVEFLYGDLQDDELSGSDNPSTNGNWVTVDESPKRVKGLKGAMVSRPLQVGNGQQTVQYPWDLVENVPGEKLSIHINTNESKRVIRRLGRSLLRASRRNIASNPPSP